MFIRFNEESINYLFFKIYLHLHAECRGVLFTGELPVEMCPVMCESRLAGRRFVGHGHKNGAVTERAGKLRITVNSFCRLAQSSGYADIMCSGIVYRNQVRWLLVRTFSRSATVSVTGHSTS